MREYDPRGSHLLFVAADLVDRVKRCGGARDEVVYIKSILSKPFTGGSILQGDCFALVHVLIIIVSPPKNFPGMAESTWLSRSFADQGVKLRIRKEARTLL